MKDTKINIKVGNDKLTQEEINSHKDFNTLLKKYTAMKTSWYKNPKKLGGISSMVVTVTVVVTVGIVKHHKNTTPSIPVKAITVTLAPVANTTTKNSSNRFVNPPIKNVDVPYKSYRVDAAKGGMLSYGEKSKITIPKFCFVDRSGNPVKGMVDIKYREFHNPVDFFMSGIPMTYDSAGKQYTFESAGMMDIRGFKDGEPIEIAQGKNIQVQMASCGKGNNYNTYALDTVAKKWVYLEKTKTVEEKQSDISKPLPPKDSIAAPEKREVEQAKTQMAKTELEEKKLETTKPVQPQKAGTSAYTFDISADAKEFPELSVYKNMLFEVDQNDKAFKPDYAKTTWEDATLKRVASNAYMFTVKKGSESHVFSVHPVFEGTNYNAAMKEYDKKYKEYESALTVKKEQEKKEQEAYLAKVKKQEEEEKRQLEIYAKQMEAQKTSSTVINFLVVKNFGFVNCDHPGVLPEGAKLAARYQDNNNDNLSNATVYLVEKGRNAIFTYNEMSAFLFNPDKENFAWCITPDNRLAVYSVDDFKKIQQRSGDFTFDMNVTGKKIESDEDVKTAFKSFL